MRPVGVSSSPRRARGLYSFASYRNSIFNAAARFPSVGRHTAAISCDVGFPRQDLKRVPALVPVLARHYYYFMSAGPVLRLGGRRDAIVVPLQSATRISCVRKR